MHKIFLKKSTIMYIQFPTPLFCKKYWIPIILSICAEDRKMASKKLELFQFKNKFQGNCVMTNVEHCYIIKHEPILSQLIELSIFREASHRLWDAFRLFYFISNPLNDRSNGGGGLSFLSLFPWGLLSVFKKASPKK